MKRFDDYFYELEEIGGLNRFVSSAIKKSKSLIQRLFSLSSLSFGKSRSAKLSIDIPEGITEGARKSLNSGSARKSAGSQVECFSCLSLGGMLRQAGFQVEYKLNGTQTTVKGMEQYIDKLRKILTDNKIASAKSKKLDLKKVREKLKKDESQRFEFGIATGQRLFQEIIKVTNSEEQLPDLYTVEIHAAGEAGTGSTKADLLVTISKVDEKAFSKKIKQLFVSHKYSWEKSLGTQTTPYGMLFSIISGETPKSSSMGRNQQKEIVISFAKKVIGSNAEQKLDNYTYFTGSKKARNEQPIKFKNHSKLYFAVAEKAVRKNPENIYKLMGLEKGVEHFFVNKTKGKGSEGKYTTAYSNKSQKYNSIYEKLYDEEIKKDLKIKMTNTGESLEIQFYWKKELVFYTKIDPILSDTNTVMKIDGVGLEDIEDSIVSHDVTKGNT